MRLIDADALIADIKECIEAKDDNFEWEQVEGLEVALSCVDDAPTIEERKTGKWIYDGYDHPHGIEWCHCSICGNRDSVGSVYTQVDIYPYCAKCGAKMEVENAKV